LIEDVALVTVAVPRQLPELVKSSAPAPDAPGGAVLVGDVDFGSAPDPVPFPPLGATSAEIDAVAQAWSGPGRPTPVVLRREKATESAVRAAVAGGARLLHVASHGFFLDDPSPQTSAATASTRSLAELLPGGMGLSALDAAQLPPGLFSGLALAGANTSVRSTRVPGAGRDDGLWTALEVAEADLSGLDLVVLSACETGLGRAARGEGMIGLQRAFQVAGARTVVASLWKVDDVATQALMTAFHRRIRDGRSSRLEALRQAQIEMLRGRLLPANSLRRGVGRLTPARAGTTGSSQSLPPTYWAAFVLSGDWR
jgi:CHAT domain-containing protein